MSVSPATIEVRVERLIPASPNRVYDAWLDPRVKGTPWEMNDRLIFDPKVDGLWYWLIDKTAHYGRFIRLDRGRAIEHTWVSPYTLGRESIVSISFEGQGEATRMVLLHSGLPDDEVGRGHEEGWQGFLDVFTAKFAGG